MVLLPAQDHCSHSSRVKEEEATGRGEEKGKGITPGARTSIAFLLQVRLGGAQILEMPNVGGIINLG